MFKRSDKQWSKVCSIVRDRGMAELHQELLDLGCLPNTFDHVEKDLGNRFKLCINVSFSHLHMMTMSQGSIEGSYTNCKKAQLDAISFVEACIDARCKTLGENFSSRLGKS